MILKVYTTEKIEVIAESNASAMSPVSFKSPRFLMLVLVLVTTEKFNLVQCNESDGIDNQDDENLVHIGKIDQDSCTVDKEMGVTFAGVQVVCGENYFLAGFDKKPKVVLNRANVVSIKCPVYNFFSNFKGGSYTFKQAMNYSKVTPKIVRLVSNTVGYYS